VHRAEAALSLAVALPELSAPAALSLGPVEVHAFGALMTLAFIVFHVGFVRRSRLPRGVGDRLAIATEGAALLGLFVVLPALTGAAARVGAQATLSTLGAAPFGALGLLGACLATRTPMRPAFDHAALAFAPALLVARTGCALAHDHLGRASEGLLAVRFADGARFDLGALEWLGLVPLVVAVTLAGRWPQAVLRQQGASALLVVVYYVCLRLALAAFAT